MNYLLESLSLDWLSLRRNFTDITFIFGILNGYILCPELLALIGFRVPRQCTRNLDDVLVIYYSI